MRNNRSRQLEEQGGCQDDGDDNRKKWCETLEDNQRPRIQRQSKDEVEGQKLVFTCLICFETRGEVRTSDESTQYPVSG